MKLVLIADTHGKHRRLKLPAADLIVHAGDSSFEGADYQAEDFLNWFGSLPYRRRIFIACNHDFYPEELTEGQVAKRLPPGVLYLNHSGAVVEGLKVWGSPVPPRFLDWALNRCRGRDIASDWKKNPPGTDLLITHGPPASVLGRTKAGRHVGCEDLMKRVKQIKPKLHVFGHIHEAYGIVEQEKTVYINASVVDANFRRRNAAVLYEL